MTSDTLAAIREIHALNYEKGAHADWCSGSQGLREDCEVCLVLAALTAATQEGERLLEAAMVLVKAHRAPDNTSDHPTDHPADQCMRWDFPDCRAVLAIEAIKAKQAADASGAKGE